VGPFENRERDGRNGDRTVAVVCRCLSDKRRSRTSMERAKRFCLDRPVRAVTGALLSDSESRIGKRPDAAMRLRPVLLKLIGQSP